MSAVESLATDMPKELEQIKAPSAPHSGISGRLSAQQCGVVQLQFRHDRAETPAGSAKNNSHIERVSQQPKLATNTKMRPYFAPGMLALAHP